MMARRRAPELVMVGDVPEALTDFTHPDWKNAEAVERMCARTGVVFKASERDVRSMAWWERFAAFRNGWCALNGLTTSWGVIDQSRAEIAGVDTRSVTRFRLAPPGAIKALSTPNPKKGGHR